MVWCEQGKAYLSVCAATLSSIVLLDWVITYTGCTLRVETRLTKMGKRLRRSDRAPTQSGR